METKIKFTSMGGKLYLDQEVLLDFLAERARLVVEGLRVKNTPLGDTEYLRGQSYELEIIKNAISPPT